MELDTSPTKIRSGLIYISLIIILWHLAGGSIKSDVGLLGGGISFKRTEYLEYMGVAIFFYLLFRYNFILRASFYDFQTNITLELAADKQFMDFGGRLIVGKKNNKSEAVRDRQGKPWGETLSNYYRTGYRSDKSMNSQVPISLDKFFMPGAIFFLEKNTAVHTEELNNFRMRGGVDRSFPITFTERCVAQWYVIIAVIRTMMNGHVFYEILFPLVLSIIAYVVLAINFVKMAFEYI